jgi:hypothetical protein
VIPFAFDYASPSTFEADAERATLGLSADARRPVRFDADVAPGHRIPLRFALETLGKLIWSEDRWIDDGDYRAIVLDPIVTVDDDRVSFEGFSQDRAAYGAVIVDRACFTPRGPVVEGTTNVDFTAWLYAAISEMRSTRATRFSVGAQGLGVSTGGGGGRFERKVDVPEAWLRAFLELQAAMALPGPRLDVRPVDLLAIVRYLERHRARTPPRGLRWCFDPGVGDAPGAARVVLEPWEHAVPLVGARHGYAEPRVIRTWGRRKLALIAPLLPYAERAQVHLRGRGMPTFFVVDLGGVRFVLGLSSYTDADWSTTGLALAAPHVVDADVQAARAALGRAVRLDHAGLGAALADARAAATATVDARTVAGVESELVRRGHAVWDLEARVLRRRELFDVTPDLTRVFPLDGRALDARWLVERGEVVLESSAPRETRKPRRFRDPITGAYETRVVVHRDWQTTARGPDGPVEVVTSDEGRLLFVRCGCAFFRANTLQKGPCAHALAALSLGEAARVERASSDLVAAEAPEAATRAATRAADDEDDEDEEAEA